MERPEDDLRRTVEEVEGLLRAIDERAASRPPAPGKWSAKQVLGHLIDSASNNHQRFVRAAFGDELVFPGYDQEAWVDLQRYRDAPWEELVLLWRSYNLHLARVVAALPEDAREKRRATHNVDEIGWQTVERGTPVTLDAFVADYVGHLKHHLRQIVRAVGGEPRGRLREEPSADPAPGRAR